MGDTGSRGGLEKRGPQSRVVIIEDSLAVLRPLLIRNLLKRKIEDTKVLGFVSIKERVAEKCNVLYDSHPSGNPRARGYRSRGGESQLRVSNPSTAFLAAPSSRLLLHVDHLRKPHCGGGEKALHEYGE